MKDLIWKKQDKATDADPAIMDFLAGDDVKLDRELLLFDLTASAAHARGLAQAGILDDGELNQLLNSMEQLVQDVRNGTRVLDSRYEDGHSAIESWLTEMLGDLGGKGGGPAYIHKPENQLELAASGRFHRRASSHRIRN